jgi:hypothetical protein
MVQNYVGQDGNIHAFIHSFIHSFHSFHWHVQNATIPCCSQELLPFLSVMYVFLPPFSTNYTSIISRIYIAICFLVYLSILLFPNSYIIPFWKFCFLPFSVHAQTNLIYLTLLRIEIYIYKSLAYRYRNNLNKLGRYCDSHLKVVESHNHIIAKFKVVVYHACNFDSSIHVFICVHRCTELWLWIC